MPSTVRFSEIVKKCGRPEEHLIFGDPKQDCELQAAVKAVRVMTLFQNNVGSKADRAAVGLEVGPGRQFLIFPKSLRDYEDRTVVGIKYELVETPEPAAGERMRLPRNPPPAKKAAQQKAAPGDEDGADSEDKFGKALAAFALGAASEDEDKKDATAPKNQPAKVKTAAPPKKKAAAKKIQTTAPHPAEARAAKKKVKADEEKPRQREPAPGRSAEDLLKGIRRAIQLLEKGQSVPAYKTLKDLVEG